MYKSSDIFVPGGMPDLTYVNRKELNLESKLQREVDEGYKIVCITGQTKSGKTVLCKRVFGEENCVWVQGGHVSSINEFYECILAELDLPESETELHSASRSAGLSSIIELQKSLSNGKTITFNNRNARTLLNEIKSKDYTLIVDDFHYMPLIAQKAIIRALKSEVFDGLRAILIAAPHHAFDAINAEREMEGRFAHIEIPIWSLSDLVEIPRKGFPLLNCQLVSPSDRFLAEEAFGSPLLMQRYCARICQNYGISNPLPKKKQINPSDSVKEEIFEDVARQFGLPAFKKLVAGPQSRTDRLKRKLKESEKTVDIYECILFAIAKTGPLPEVSYNEIRTTLQEIIIEQDVPQKNQITNALSNMSKIAKEEIEGEPVVEWMNDTLYITDPFLMFYLRWVTRRELNRTNAQANLGVSEILKSLMKTLDKM